MLIIGAMLSGYAPTPLPFDPLRTAKDRALDPSIQIDCTGIESDCRKSLSKIALRLFDPIVDGCPIGTAAQTCWAFRIRDDGSTIRLSTTIKVFVDEPGSRRLTRVVVETSSIVTVRHPSPPGPGLENDTDRGTTVRNLTRSDMQKEGLTTTDDVVRKIEQLDGS